MSALPASLPIAGYSFDQAPDLADPSERARLSAHAMRGFLQIADRWRLSEVQRRGLLGGVASSTFHAWKTTSANLRLSQDELTRISLVIGIYKALHMYLGEPWADRWVTLGNRGASFAGEPPLEYMLRRGLPGMLEIRRMLEAWRAGY